jgi:hypothetical protein
MANQGCPLGDILAGRRLSNRGVNADAEWTLVELGEDCGEHLVLANRPLGRAAHHRLGGRPVTFAEELQPVE